MKHKIIALLSLLCLAATFVACNDYETYGDKKDKERAAIKQFLADSAINVISEDVFHKQGDITNNDKNEFVYMNNTGVYMQIVHKGCGEPLRDGENSDLMVRFLELCLLDSSAIYNDTAPYDVDVMNVRRQGNVFTASLTDGVMMSAYNTESVPTGWLVPLKYVNVGRPRTEDDQIAKVRLIVPHTQGHSVASSYVYPYYYEISFVRSIDI
ncbi:DUF4827 domain-containing protein [Prevotella sp. E13-17]|uniref:DUF4827 domain-containing protein n=1 Tax=Prevotella sp. E13-17 TaxID=2913616 RepID=UPI001EDB25CD|nr:DUF4827 domain-containing protein [Prevotella sp. E13-17]UKK50565.1 DUF4827 domain-containing protein [Prevotella sp. E13-17]